MLYDRFDKAYKIIENYPLYNEKDVEAMRKALIETYSNTTVDFAPTNPNIYFMDIENPRDIIVWDAITRNKSFSMGLAHSYSETLDKIRGINVYDYTDKINYRVNPMSRYYDMENIIKKAGVTPAVEMYEDIVDHLPINMRYSDVHDLITDSLGTYIKSPEDLGIYRMDIDNYIRSNVSAYNKLKPLDDFIDNTPIPEDSLIAQAVKRTRNFGSTLNIPTDVWGKFEPEHRLTKLLKSYDVSPNTDILATKARLFYSIERNDVLNQTIESFNAKQFRSWLDHNTNGFLFYEIPKGYGKEDINLIAKFTDEELQQAGLIVTPLKKNKNIYFIRRVDNIITNEDYNYLKPFYLIEELQDSATSALIGTKAYLNEDMPIDVPMEIYRGSSVDNKVLKTMFTNEELAELLGDETIQKRIQIWTN